ncbi:MAG: protease modulator HflC, partial [Thermoanaerobaculia bacterium]
LFGRPVGDAVASPGLHLKLPFAHQVNRFDKRFLEWDGDPNELTTKDKRFIFVDTTARWRITDPLLYFQRLRNETGAQSRLDDILDGESRNAIANHDLVEVVRSTDRTAEVHEGEPDAASALPPIQVGRERIRAEILARAQQRTADLGIEILDVRFKRIDYVAAVQAKVFERMTAERRRIADRYRSEGEGEAARIRGEMERELRRVQSEAYRQAQEITGKADGEAAAIYARAYDQSAEARDFYGFLKSMETLHAGADQQTVAVLSTDGELYRFLDESQ